MKDNLPFFSHDNNARRHPKMKALIAEYGYEGYGRFWALNERIAESPNAYIDISKKVNKLDLAQELSFNGEELDKFLSFLADPEIDLINITEGKITTDRISELYSKVVVSREYERDKKQRQRGNGDCPEGNMGESDTEYNRIEREKNKNRIKQKEKKGKEIPEGSDEPSFSEKQSLELSTLLLTSHRKEIPDFLSGKDKSVIPKWASDIEKLIRIDQKSPETIREVILWAKTPDNFWFANIMSGKKLREKFETLYGQMKMKRRSTGPPPHKISRDNIPADQVSKYFKQE